LRQEREEKGGEEGRVNVLKWKKCSRKGKKKKRKEGKVIRNKKKKNGKGEGRGNLEVSFLRRG